MQGEKSIRMGYEEDEKGNECVNVRLESCRWKTVDREEQSVHKMETINRRIARSRKRVMVFDKIYEKIRNGEVLKKLRILYQYKRLYWMGLPRNI